MNKKAKEFLYKQGLSDYDYMDDGMIEHISENMQKYHLEQLNLSGVGSSGSEFEKDLFKLINNYCKNGFKKPELVRKIEWVLGSCKMS